MTLWHYKDSKSYSATKRSRNFLLFDRLIPVEYDETKIVDTCEFLLRKRGHFPCSFWRQGWVMRGTGNESPSTSYREVMFPVNEGKPHSTVWQFLYTC